MLKESRLTLAALPRRAIKGHAFNAAGVAQDGRGTIGLVSIGLSNTTDQYLRPAAPTHSSHELMRIRAKIRR